MAPCCVHGPLPVLDMHEGRTLLTAGLTMAALLAVSAMRAVRCASVLGKTNHGGISQRCYAVPLQRSQPVWGTLTLSTGRSVSWR